MTTEVWLRNPADFIREAVEVNHLMFAWDRGYVHKRQLDPQKYLDLIVPEPQQYRMLLIGEQGSAEVNRQTSVDKPHAVYPTWTYGESMALLEEMIYQPVGEDPSICEDESIPRDIRPVLGQEHRVILSDLPPASTGPGRSFLRAVAKLQSEVPECIVHVHGLYSWRLNFGLGFRAADVDPRTTAQKGKVYLPMGREVRYEVTAEYPQWIRVLGFQYADLEKPRNRCMYNIKSALWAAANWDDNLKFTTEAPPGYKPDVESIDPTLPQTNSHQTTKAVAKPGDKFLCDQCSLVAGCKYYRKGAVCSVPRSDGKKMADMFRSRDADQIIDALGSIVGKQADRVERGLQDEEFDDDLSPEVTKMMNGLFKNGVTLAKLLKPDLNGKGQSVMVNVGGGHTAGVFSPQQMTAKVVAELEAQGIARKDITPDMIANVLDPSRDHSQPAMIEAQVVRDDEQE